MRLNLSVVLAIGALVGALDRVGIFFVPEEPYQVEIFLAAILKGALVGLLTGLSLKGPVSWGGGIGYGLMYGVFLALVVFFAKGGLRSMEAPLVVPFGAVAGAITGLLVARFGFSRGQRRNRLQKVVGRIRKEMKAGDSGELSRRN